LFWRFLGGLHAIGAWFVGNSTATAAWLALLIAIGTLLHEVVQGQRLPNPSKIEEWMAYNEFRQYCESQLDKGNLWNDCNKTLALQIKAPPLIDIDAFMEDDKLFSRRHPLAKRIAALLRDGLKHGMKVHSLNAVLFNANQLKDNNSGISNLDLDAGVNAQSSNADLPSSRTQRYQPRSTVVAMAQDVSMHVAMGYLPLLAIAILLLYICLYTLLRRRRLSRQSQVGGLFKRDVRAHSSTRSAPLSLFAAEDLELGYGERYSVDNQIINEIAGTSGCSANIDIDGTMDINLH
jgi:hypothetical protein